MSTLIVLLTLALVPAASRAQMDPSTALLLRGSTPAPSLEALEDEVHLAPRPAPRRPRARIQITPAVAPAEATPAPTAYTPPPSWVRVPAATEAPAVVREETLSVRLGLGYFGLDSHGGLGARTYVGGGPAVKLGITLWATPAFGLKADYLTTVGADVRDARGHQGLDHQEIDAAIVYRASRVGPRWQFGLGLHHNENLVAQIADGPLGGRSLGPDASVSYTRPAGEAYAHVFEAHLQPYLNHRELGSDDRAGSGPAGAAFGGSISIGGHLDLESRRRLFWRLRYAFERDTFPRGASVDVGQAWLSLGGVWGS